MVLLQNVWWYLVLIGVMILIHELGHYWAARFFDVKVETFSFGFGPRLFGFRKGETDFRFSAILFGGYVKMLGEQPGEETLDPRSLIAKPRWQRMVIAFAGPAINVVLAVALLTGLFMVHYERIANSQSPVIGEVIAGGAAAKAGVQIGDKIVQLDDTVNPTWEDIKVKELTSAHRPMTIWAIRKGERLRFDITPVQSDSDGGASAGWNPEFDVQVSDVIKGKAAEKAGLRRGDVLVSVNGERLRSVTRLNEIENITKGAPLDLVFEREGQQHRISVVPALEKSEGSEKEQWLIGLRPTPRVEITKLNFRDAVVESGRANLQTSKIIFRFLEGIVERRMSAKSVQGPLRIAQMSGEAFREGWLQYFLLMAGVSLNLAIFNLLPIPILDGGVILMLFVEMLMRRDLDLRVKEAVLKVGFVFLMVIVVFVLYNDLSKMLAPS
jgi:regulator of sigma E protease